MQIETRLADYHDAADAGRVAELLDRYARDPMGGGQGLDPAIKARLATTLAAVPNAFSVLCLVDGEPAGLANCFQALSTFKCRPLINIHDLVVDVAYRGRGLGACLLREVERVARDRGCCKITLEVLSGNVAARRCYEKFGFLAYQLDPASGAALFWEKPIEPGQS